MIVIHHLWQGAWHNPFNVESPSATGGSKLFVFRFHQGSHPFGSIPNVETDVWIFCAMYGLSLHVEHVFLWIFKYSYGVFRSFLITSPPLSSFALLLTLPPSFLHRHNKNIHTTQISPPQKNIYGTNKHNFLFQFETKKTRSPYVVPCPLPVACWILCRNWWRSTHGALE